MKNKKRLDRIVMHSSVFVDDMTHVKEGDFGEGKVADLKRSQKMHRVGIGRWEFIRWTRRIFCEDTD